MAFEPTGVREARQAVRYDGTNSAEINNAISDLQIVSEDPTTGLTFTSAGEQYTVAPNGYLAWYQGEVTDVFQNQADFESVYASTAVDSHVHDLVLTTGPAKDAPTEE
jgi:hypothetical protein